MTTYSTRAFDSLDEWLETLEGRATFEAPDDRTALATFAHWSRSNPLRCNHAHLYREGEEHPIAVTWNTLRRTVTLDQEGNEVSAVSFKPSHEKRFPVNGGAGQTLPWAFVELFGTQIFENHSRQSLEDLARRGGLSIGEIAAAIQGKHPQAHDRYRDVGRCQEIVAERLQQWERMCRDWGTEVRYLCDDRDGEWLNELAIVPGGNGDWYIAIVPQGTGTMGKGLRLCTSGGFSYQSRAHQEFISALAELYRELLQRKNKA